MPDIRPNLNTRVAEELDLTVEIQGMFTMKSDRYGWSDRVQYCTGIRDAHPDH
jgi:hypothetical protein